MTENVLALGLGAPLADPVSIWPATTVIELAPEVAARLRPDPSGTLRSVIAKLAAVDAARVADVVVTSTPSGSALVRLGSESEAMRALHVAARRRATSAAEALHAAVLGLD